jgi:hypothetical protein
MTIMFMEAIIKAYVMNWKEILTDAWNAPDTIPYHMHALPCDEVLHLISMVNK